MQRNQKKQSEYFNTRIQLMKTVINICRKLLVSVILITLFFLFTDISYCQTLKINDSEYFETTGVNVLVFSNQYNGMFFDEKTAGIEIIHHGVRTATGGAVRLSNTPEQWDLVPQVIDRKVDKKIIALR